MREIEREIAFTINVKCTECVKLCISSKFICILWIFRAAFMPNEVDGDVQRVLIEMERWKICSHANGLKQRTFNAFICLCLSHTKQHTEWIWCWSKVVFRKAVPNLQSIMRFMGHFNFSLRPKIMRMFNKCVISSEMSGLEPVPVYNTQMGGQWIIRW